MAKAMMNDESFIIALSESVCGHVYIDKVGRVQKEELQDDIYISGGSRGTYIRSKFLRAILTSQGSELERIDYPNEEFSCSLTSRSAAALQRITLSFSSSTKACGIEISPLSEH
jgi:hypothetical protein